MRRIHLFLAVLTFAVSGCAFSPQAVVIRPQLAPPVSTAATGQAVAIRVVDERPRSTLGTRGAQGVGAELTIAGNLQDIVAAALADGLRQRGFAPTLESTREGRELRVEIRNLDYRLVVGFWAGTLATECGLKAVCIRGSERPFEQLYRGEFGESIQVVQGDEANNRYVTEAVSRALNAMLGDPRLLQCLAN